MKQASPYADTEIEEYTPQRSGLHVKTHSRVAAAFAILVSYFSPKAKLIKIKDLGKTHKHMQTYKHKPAQSYTEINSKEINSFTSKSLK